MKSCHSYLVIACFQLLASCSLGQRAHRELHVCAGKVSEGVFFDYISKSAKELGYRPSTGIAEDDRGQVTTVMKATRWTTSIWATNETIGPGLNDPNGEVIPRHDTFVVSVDGAAFAAKQVDSTYYLLGSKLSRDAYRIHDRDQPC